MSLTLFYLPSAEFSTSLHYDYVQATDAMALIGHASTTLSLIPSATKASEVLMIIPINILSWHAVMLPKGMAPNSPRLRTVLGSLLEERLLDEPEQLHLALAAGVTPGPTQNGVPATDKAARYWVAACDKSWLQSHMQAFESAGIAVGRIVPEFAPDSAPATDAVKLHVMGEPAQPLLVAVGQAVDGVVCLPLTALSTASVLSWFSTSATQDAAKIQSVIVEPCLAALAESFFGSQISIQNRQQRWLDACGSGWDMAQFDLVSSGRTRLLKRFLGAGRQWLYAPHWRPVRWGLAALLGVNLVGLNIGAWKEQSVQQAQRTAIQDTLTQTFPQVKVVIDAPLQMQREVDALRQATGTASSNGLEAVLAAIGNAPLVTNSPSAIDLSNGDIKIKGLKLSAQAASGLSAPLKALGYDASINGDALRITPANQRMATP